MRPSTETLELLEYIRAEINCGQVLFPKTDLDRVHNNACQRAMNIITNYAEGFGLFQMTKKLPAHPKAPERVARKKAKPLDKP